MTKIKICGLKRPEDIAAVNEAGADYAGFVFAQSRRRVTPEEAKSLRAGLSTGIVPVGVFVDEEPEQIIKLWLAGTIAMAQLHGQESPAYVRELKAACSMPVIKAIRMDGGVDVKQYELVADCLLFDSGAGSGKTFDWTRKPKTKLPFFLAGGLHPGNVKKAIQATEPFGVDMSSGVETNGAKSREKILAAVRSVRDGNEG